MKKVSVIMPVYNAEQWVGQAIESIQNQTYSEWELIIVNDGSSDSTKQICERYANIESRIKLFEQENQGPSAARNLGLSKMEGDFFTMIDSDDHLYETALETYINAIENDNSDMVVAGYRIQNDLKGTTQEFTNNKTEKIESRGNLNTESFDKILQKKLMASNWNKLYSKKLSNLRFREDLSMNEDVIFSLTAASSADTISIIPNIVYLYRIQNEDSLSLKFNKDYCTSLDDIDEILIKNQKGHLRRGIKRWIMGYMFIYLRKCCRINVSIEEKVKLLKEATSCKVFKKYARIVVADTMNKKISTALLKIGAYKKYIKLVNGKGE